MPGAGLEDPSSFDWYGLGEEVSDLFRTCPGVSCMLGPLTAEVSQTYAAWTQELWILCAFDVLATWYFWQSPLLLLIAATVKMLVQASAPNRSRGYKTNRMPRGVNFPMIDAVRKTVVDCYTPACLDPFNMLTLPMDIYLPLLSPQAKLRHCTQRKQKRPLAEVVAPDQLQQIEETEKQETDRNMNVMWKVLEECGRAVPMTNLVLNHRDFPQTVENYFTLSFLVRVKAAQWMEVLRSNCKQCVLSCVLRHGRSILIGLVYMLLYDPPPISPAHIFLRLQINLE